MIAWRRTAMRSAHLALKGRPTGGDKGLKTPSSADNRLIDTTQTAREEAEIFIRKPEVRDHPLRRPGEAVDGLVLVHLTVVKSTEHSIQLVELHLREVKIA